MTVTRLKVGLISNPKSQRNQRDPHRLDALIKAGNGFLYERLDEMSDLVPILERMADRGIEVIALDGGDGTIQATLTALFNNRIFDRHPALCVLPSGMTNLIAADVGPRGGRERVMKRVIAAVHAGELAGTLIERDVMRLRYKPEELPLYGMFFGAGTIPRAMEWCRRVIHRMQVKGEGAVAITIAGIVFRHSFQGASAGDVFHGDDIILDYCEGQQSNGVKLLVFASTLSRLIMGSRPFWGPGEGNLKVTSIGFPADGLFWSLPRLLFGRRKERLDPHIFESRRTQCVSISTEARFALDGEIFSPEPGLPVTIENAGPMRFLRW